MNLNGLVLKTRLQLEERSISQSLLVLLYREYENIDDLNTFIYQAQDLFPRLNCGIASVYLKHLLGRGEIIRGKYLEFSHTFLLINSKTIIDITSDQYGGPRVYVGDVNAQWSLK